MKIAVLGQDQLFCEALKALIERRLRIDAVAAGAITELAAHGINDLVAIVIDARTIVASEVSLIEGAAAVRGIVLIVVRNHAKFQVPEGAKVAEDSAESLLSMLNAIPHPTLLRRPYGSAVREPGMPRRGRRPSGGILSVREFEVAELVAKGLGNRDVSQRIGLQEQSVKNLVSTIMRKVNVENRTQLALLINSQGRALTLPLA